MRTWRLMMAVATVLAVAPAMASNFCGGNGVLKLSFTAGPEVTALATVEPDASGLTSVEVYGLLDEVEPAEGPGGVLLALGGFEFELRVSGAEPLAVTKKVLVPHRDFGQRPTQVMAGVRSHGERVDQGPLALVCWTVVFKGVAADVRFDLDPAGLLSCVGMPDCVDSGAQALYSGAVDVAQEGYLFGADCAPAVLNAVGEPDLAVIRCQTGVDEVGIFKLRQ